jgi:hypothetical protein
VRDSSKALDIWMKSNAHIKQVPGNDTENTAYLTLNYKSEQVRSIKAHKHCGLTMYSTIWHGVVSSVRTDSG